GDGGERTLAVCLLPHRRALEQGFVRVGRAVATAHRLQQRVTCGRKRHALRWTVAETLPQASLTLRASRRREPAANASGRAARSPRSATAAAAASSVTATPIRALQGAGATRGDGREGHRHRATPQQMLDPWDHAPPVSGGRSRAPSRLL